MLPLFLLFFAQADPARVAGCVVDPSGQPVPQATVEVTGNHQWETAGQTDEQGCFRFRKVLAEGFELRVSQRGFWPEVRTGQQAARQYDFPTLRLRLGMDQEPELSSAPPAEWTPSRAVALRQYPEAALLAHLTGCIYVECLLSADGSVIRATAGGDPRLAQAAVANARRWRFRRVQPGSQQTLTLTYLFETVPRSSPAQDTEVSFDGLTTLRLTAPAR